MRQHIAYQRLEADSAHGHAIQIINTYTSFHQDKIDAIEKQCEHYIKSGVVLEDGEIVEEK